MAETISKPTLTKLTAADLPEKTKKSMMWGLVLGNYLSASLSTAMVAFYAEFAQKTYKDSFYINDTYVGIVLGMLEAAGLVFSPFFKILLQKMGRKNAVILGLTSMLISNTALASLSFIPPD